MKNVIFISLLAIFGIILCDQPEPRSEKDTTTTQVNDSTVFLGIGTGAAPDSIKGM